MKNFIASTLVCLTSALSAHGAEKASAPDPAATQTKPVPAKTADAPTLTLDGPLLQNSPTARIVPSGVNSAVTDPATGQPLPPATSGLAPDGKPNGPNLKLHAKPLPIPPGIYVASPYTGIVVVPGSSDEAMVNELPQTRQSVRMPMVSPDLKLTPKVQAKK
jgi:hypothetical protein